jgi:hypothetical protein
VESGIRTWGLGMMGGNVLEDWEGIAWIELVNAHLIEVREEEGGVKKEGDRASMYVDKEW